VFLVTLSFELLVLILLGYGVAVLIFLAYFFLYPLELILRRIAEYPKGPVLAIAGLVGTIAVLAKAFA
jgi:hypothetical protein